MLEDDGSGRGGGGERDGELGGGDGRAEGARPDIAEEEHEEDGTELEAALNRLTEENAALAEDNALLTREKKELA